VRESFAGQVIDFKRRKIAPPEIIGAMNNLAEPEGYIQIWTDPQSIDVPEKLIN